MLYQLFASALLLLPITVSNFGFAESDTFLKISSMFTQGQPLYMMLYASGIIFFSFFYTSIVFNPKETAENLRKYGGYVPVLDLEREPQNISILF